MVAAVTNAELIPAVRTERDILVVDPGHHGLFYCCGKKTKTKHTQREAILKKRDRVRMENKEQKEREQSSRVSYLGSSQTRYLFCQTQSADKEKKGSEGMNLVVDILPTGGGIKWE